MQQFSLLEWNAPVNMIVKQGYSFTLKKTFKTIRKVVNDFEKSLVKKGEKKAKCILEKTGEKKLNQREQEMIKRLINKSFARNAAVVSRRNIKKHSKSFFFMDYQGKLQELKIKLCVVSFKL